MILICSGAVSQKDPVGALSFYAPGYFAAVPGDGDIVGHAPNVGHGGTVRVVDLVIHKDAATVAGAVAETIAKLATESQGARFSIGLAGGTTPAVTYRILRDTTTDWSRVDAWLSDERWVPQNDTRSNGRQAAEKLLDHVSATFHRPIWNQDDPQKSAAGYEAKIRSLHPGHHPDLVLLGMGTDGHTASLFPDTAALDERERWIVANEVPQQNEMRITATYPLLWGASRIIFLVVGSEKAEALRNSFAGNTPAGRVGEGDARIEWHVDNAAASLLT